MFFRYLGDHRKLLCLLALLVIIFTVVFALYQLPAVPALYAGLLFCTAALPFAVQDFLRYRRRHDQLTRLSAGDLVLPEELPAARAAWEQDYQMLVLRLCRDRENLQEDIREIRQETENFYALWLHQIKTPIAAMSLMLQQSGEPDPAALQQELFKIEQYAGLTLEYQRIGSIAADLHARPCSLADVVRQAVKKYAPVFIYKKLRVVTEDLDRTVISDEKWLVFIIEQLLSNALKYTPAGEVNIRSAYTDDAGTVLSIQDTGIGILKEDLPRVFERGFTGRNGRIDKKATGLGLYLCDTVSRKLCHKLTIASTPGQGTCVSIHFGRQNVQVE